MEQVRTKELKFVSAVAYVHNCSEYIENFLTEVMGFIEEKFDKCELILVNDCSSDDSSTKLHDFFENHKVSYMVTVLRTGCYQGMESSMNAGRDMAIGDYVYEFDDLYVDYDRQVLMDCYHKCLEGNDIVSVGSDAPMRMTSRMFYSLFNRVSHSRNKLGQATFRLISRRAINRVKKIGAYIPYRKAVYMNCGLSAASITYKSLDTADRFTRHSRRDERTSLAVDSFIYFTDLMEKISLGISLVFMVLGLIVVIYVVSSFFTDQHLQSGWVSMMGFMAIGFTGIFGILTVILKYLSVILDLIFRQQRYLIEDVEKISRN